MTDHLLILSSDEARLLGSLYSLGAMAVLALSAGAEEEKLFQESRLLLRAGLGLKDYDKLQRSLRDKVLNIIDEMNRDAKEQASDA